MITVWHNQQYLSFWLLGFPKSVPLQQLTPVALIDANDLSEAFELSQNEFNKDERVQIINSSRSTCVGDILQKANNCWFVDRSGFAPLKQPLPHVGIVLDLYEEISEFIETFPTLDLPNWEKADLIQTIRLPDQWHYLETRRWKDGQLRQLLRCYK